MNKNLTFFRRLGFAYSGITAALKREVSLRYQFLAMGLVALFCVLQRPPLIWCACFVVMSALVIGLEMVNSAIEALLDRLIPEQDKEIKYIKDCLAGSVLAASVGAALVFLLYIFTQIEF